MSPIEYIFKQVVNIAFANSRIVFCKIMQDRRESGDGYWGSGNQENETVPSTELETGSIDLLEEEEGEVRSDLIRFHKLTFASSSFHSLPVIQEGKGD